jgi:hypothetical protein
MLLLDNDTLSDALQFVAFNSCVCDLQHTQTRKHCKQSRRCKEAEQDLLQGGQQPADPLPAAANRMTVLLLGKELSPLTLFNTFSHFGSAVMPKSYATKKASMERATLRTRLGI